MKRWLAIIVGLIISLLALYWAFQEMKPGEIWASLTQMRLGWAAAACMVVAISVLSRGVRWSVLLKRRLSIADSFWLWVIGFFFNNVLPLKLGEIARSLLAGRRPGNSFTAVLSSVIVERLFDMVAVVTLLGISLSVLPLPDWAKQSGLVLGVGAVTALIVLAITARYPAWALNLGSTILGLIPRVGKEKARAFLSPFVEGLGGVSDWKTFASGIGLTVVSWSLSVLGVLTMMMAFWPSVPLIDAVLSLSGSGLGVSIPSAPSGVGTYEAAVIGLLTTVGYNRSKTQAFALVMHAATILVTSLLGIGGLLREGVSFGQVAREAQELQGHPADAAQTQ